MSIREGTFCRILSPIVLDSTTKKKIIMRAKLSSLILILAITHAAASTFGQIKLNKKKVPIVQVLQAIKAQTDYVFIYEEKLLADYKTSVNFNDASVEQALKEIFKELPITYEFIGKDIVLKQKEKTLLERIKKILSIPIDVRGVVRDRTGNPLGGAIVKLKGSPMAFSTNPNGEFYLNNVEENQTLVVTYIGYVTQELSVKPTMSIVMQQQIDQLAEVSIVYTGFQELDKARATGSFAKPDMEVFRNRTGTTNIITRLEGLIPGMTIVPGPRVTMSRNGSTAPNQGIIRGTSSIYLNPDPLFVVNNVKVDDISNINPDDVSDITVLKDAAASAIWGAEAANGVIVITTKKGTKSRELNISYNSYVNFSGKPDFDYRPVLSSNAFITAARETFSPSDYPLNTLTYNFIAPHEAILYNSANLPQAQVNAKLDSLAGINNMDQISKLFYRNALSSNQTISASAGGEVYSFYSSLSYNNTKSNRPGDKNDLYRFNFSQDIKASKRIKISLNTTLTSAKTSSIANLTVDNRFLPYQLFSDGNGSPIAMPYMTGWSESLRREYEQRGRISLNYVPLEEVNYAHSKSNNLGINLNAGVNIDLWKGLSFRGTYGYQKSPGSTESYRDIKSFASRMELLSNTVSPTISSVPTYYLPTTGGRYTTGNTDQQNWTVRNQLSFLRLLRKGKDRLSLEAGQDIQERQMKSRGATVYGYNEALMSAQLPDYAAINRGINPIIWGNRPLDPVAIPVESLNRFSSWFGLASYSFDGKYNLDASWRIDHSNLFGSDKATQNKPVWSMGAKWLLAREDFMQKLNWLNELSIRATYGIAGNSPVGAGSTFNILNADYGTNPGGPSLSISLPANNKLSWEVTRTKNLGFDAAVFNNRIGLSLDFYHKRTRDLLGSMVLNPLTGHSSIVGNLGELTNRGIDLSLRTVNLQSRDFKWSSNLVFSYNKNKLIDYGVPSPYANQAGSKLSSSYFAGYSMMPMFAYQYAGLDGSGNPMIKLQDGSTTKQPYVAKGEDVTYQGTIVPRFNGGFSNTVSYKGFSLTANMIYNLGHVMRRDVNEFYTGRLSGGSISFIGNIHPDFNSRWKSPGDEALTDIPAYVANINDSYNNRDINYYLKGDRNVVDASYIKLRELTLNYLIPSGILSKVNIASANVFFQASNFMIWKANDDNIDPEFHNLSTGQRNIPPFKHAFSIGTNLSF